MEFLLFQQALYSSNAAERYFRNHLRSCTRNFDFECFPADPYIWMRPAMKADGTSYYGYILLYTDDVIVISEDAEEILRNKLNKYFELKPISIGLTKMYLESRARKVKLDNEKISWAFSSSKYVQAAVKNLQSHLDKQEKYKMLRTAETPMTTSYRPELDVTPKLDHIMAVYYMSLIGILQWIVELGRVDICLEVSMMSSHMALPRLGHTKQLFHIFSHIIKYHITGMVFDPSNLVIDESKYQRRD